MGGFLTGLEVGNKIASESVDSYERAREWQDKIKNLKDERAIEQKRIDSANSKERYSEFERGVADDRLAGKISFDQQLDKQRLDETARHNKATETWESNFHPARPAPGTALTPYQKERLITTSTKNLLSARQAKDDNGVTMYSKQLADLGVPIPPAEDPHPILHWLTNKISGGSSAQPLTGGKPLPGLD